MGFWSRLFNIEPEPCATCDVLQEALALERARYNELLQRILPRHVSPNLAEPSLAEVKPAMPIPWKVKRQMLEEQDREKAKLMKQFQPSNEEIEKEMGI